MSKPTPNTFSKLARFFATPFAVFLILLTLKTYLARVLLFEDANLWHAIWLEIGIFACLAALIELIFRRSKPYIYFVCHLLLSLVLLACVVYFRQFDRIPIYSAIYQLGEAEAVKTSIYTLLEPVDVLFVIDIVVWLVLRLWGNWRQETQPVFHKLVLVVVLIAAAGLTSYHIMSKTSEDLLDTSKLATDIGLFNAQGYEIYAGLTDTNQLDVSLVNQKNINQLKGITVPAKPKYFGVDKNKNLIVIQMESFQNFLMGLKVNGQEITPNLNKMMKQDLYFQNFNSQIGQGNTNDAEFISNTSLYPLESGAMSTFYNDRVFPSMPRLLGSKGYDTFTMHVNIATFYNRNKMYPALGFKQYYDQTYFGKDDMIGLGASDEVLYQKSLPLLAQRVKNGQKFYANYVTLSSHNPFVLPAGKDDLQLPPEFDGTMLGDYLHAAHYTDKQIGAFFDQLKKNGLWDKTVIALYGDHFAFNPNTIKPDDHTLLVTLLDRDYDSVDQFNIPLLIHAPGMKPQVVKQVGGQVDLFPTLANLLGLSLKGQIHFGEDLLNQTHNAIGERYYAPKGSFLDNDILFLSENETVIDRHTHSTTNGLSQHRAAEHDAVTKLEEWSDAFIDHLPKREATKGAAQ